MTALARALRPVRLRVRLVRLAAALDWGLLALAVYSLGLRAVLFFVAVEYPAVYLTPIIALAATCDAAAWLWPVSASAAAAACDRGGLKQRARTALEHVDDGSPMAEMQREDTLRALKALDVKSALPIRESRSRMWAVWACVMISATLAFVPNPQEAVIAQKQLLREDLKEQAEKIEKAADAPPDSLDPDQLAELRKLAKELSQSLRTSETSRDALLALNEAGDAIKKIERLSTQSAVGAASKALNAGGLDGLRQALESGDAEQMRSAAEDLASGDPNALSQALSAAAASAPAGSALQAALQNAAQAAPGAAQSAALGQLAGKLSATASTAPTSQLGALVASAKAGLGAGSGSKSTSSGGQGQKGTGSGGGAGKGGQGQGGGAGAGMGTTSKDAGYKEGGARKPGSNAGSGAPVVKTGAYESIYDPTRLGDGGEVSQSEGKVSDGDVSRADLAPGLGTAGGTVPFARSAHSYAQAAASAADRPGVPEDVQKMVSAYFSALIDESEG